MRSMLKGRSRSRSSIASSQSQSTSSLPPSSPSHLEVGHDTSLQATLSNPSNASHVDVSDFCPADTSLLYPTRPGQSNKRYPPSSFSLKRTLSFGRKKEKRISREESSPLGALEEGGSTRSRSEVVLPTPDPGTPRSPIGEHPPSPSQGPLASLPFQPAARARANVSPARGTYSPHGGQSERFDGPYLSPTAPMSHRAGSSKSSAKMMSEVSLQSSSSSHHPLHLPRAASTSQRSSPSPRKLVKKQSGVANVDHEALELAPRRSEDVTRSNFSPYIAPRPLSHNPPPGSLPVQQLAPLTPPDEHLSHDRPITSTMSHLLPEGAGPPELYPSSLERNPSSSTTTSSTFGPCSTEESAMVQTPQDSYGAFVSVRDDSAAVEGEDRTWGGEWDDTVRRGWGLERTSNWSFHVGDDSEPTQWPESGGNGKGKERERVDFVTSWHPDGTPSGDASYGAGLGLGVGLPDSEPLRPPSPTSSVTASAVTHTTSSSTSTAKARSSRRPPSSTFGFTGKDLNPIDTEPGPSHPRRSVAFETADEADGPRRRARPPIIRLRSASLGNASMTTSSVYSTVSIGEIGHAQEGVVAHARTVRTSSSPAPEILASPEDDQTWSDDWPLTREDGDQAGRPEVDRIVERMKASSGAMSRAFEMEERDRKRAQRVSLTTRRPPFPPHLAGSSSQLGLPDSPTTAKNEAVLSSPVRSEATKDAVPGRPPLPARSSSLSQLWRRISTGGSTKRPKDKTIGTDRLAPPRRQSSLSVHVSQKAEEDVPEVPPPVSPVDIRRLIRKASRGKMRLRVDTKAQTPGVDEHGGAEGSGGRLVEGDGGAEIPDVPPLPLSAVSYISQRKSSLPSSAEADQAGKVEETAKARRTAQAAPYIAERNSSLAELPLAASPLQMTSSYDISRSAQHLDAFVEDYFSLRPIAPSASSSTSGSLNASATVSAKTRPGPSGRPPVISESPEDYATTRYRRRRLASTSAPGVGDDTDSIDEETKEKRRKYRQTLVEIKDDVVFHRVLVDLARLQERSERGGSSASTPIGTPLVREPDLDAEVGDRARNAMSHSGGLPTQDLGTGAGALFMRPTGRIMRTPSRIISERKATERGIKAWFVTREIVQGERRYGRLLARGVAIVQAAAASLANSPAPSALSLAPSPSASSSTQTSLSASLSRLTSPARGKSPSRLRKRTQSISLTTSASSTTLPIGTPATPSRLPPRELSSTSINDVPAPNPLDILLDRLPRLLALSLTLSARFEHDPSPAGVAQAFCEMESEMVEEMGLWAGDVGGLIALGLGNYIDRSASGSATASASGSATTMASPTSRRTSWSFLGGGASGDDGLPRLPRSVMQAPMRNSTMDSLVVDDPDERLGFSDIIVAPVTRAMRYKLLFKELLDQSSAPTGLTSTPTASTPQRNESVSEREAIEQALFAADRLAIECDTRQAFDLDELRRGRKTAGRERSDGRISKQGGGKEMSGDEGRRRRSMAKKVKGGERRDSGLGVYGGGGQDRELEMNERHDGARIERNVRGDAKPKMKRRPRSMGPLARANREVIEGGSGARAARGDVYEVGGMLDVPAVPVSALVPVTSAGRRAGSEVGSRVGGGGPSRWKVGWGD